MTLLEEFEALCKYIREVTVSDLVCGLCEYDAGTVGEEPTECPGFDSDECFKLKESLRKRYEMEAIPVEWITGWIDRRIEPEDHYYFNALIDEWEKENETN